MEHDAIRAALLAWYDQHRRDLPWRQDRDPYRIWISEAMLQQTRVQTVLPYYQRWMERFPDVDALANATEEDVVAAWAGLGYYGRARRLHHAAQIVTAQGMPRDANGLRTLPGLGPYMAGAIASIAFQEPVPAIDGNVQRVMSRLACIDACIDTAAGARAVAEVATQLVDPARPGDWNQALMDLGSRICTPTGPRCDGCPLQDHCAAYRMGRVADLPVRRPKRRPSVQSMHFAIIRDGLRVLVVPRPKDGLLAGTWMLPGGDADVPLEDHIRQQTDLDVRIDEGAGQARHLFTHRVWEMAVHGATVIDGTPLPSVRWVDPGSPDVALSAAALRAIAALA